MGAEEAWVKRQWEEQGLKRTEKYQLYDIAVMDHEGSNSALGEAVKSGRSCTENGLIRDVERQVGEQISFQDTHGENQQDNESLLDL